MERIALRAKVIERSRSRSGDKNAKPQAQKEPVPEKKKRVTIEMTDTKQNDPII